MVNAAETLATKEDGPRVHAVHLLGAAIGAKHLSTMGSVVDDAVYNYHSSNDKVLKFLYSVIQGGQKAAGMCGFASDGEKVRNIDVSDYVPTHFDYHGARAAALTDRLRPTGPQGAQHF